MNGNITPHIEAEGIKALFRSDFTAEMKANCIDGRYTKLPSEIARVVGRRWGVPPEIILMAFLP